MAKKTWFIVIPSFSQWDYVFATLESLQAHSDLDRTTLCLVDDASPDFPEARVKKWFEETGHICLRLDKNRGYIRTVNTGLTWARKEGRDIAVCGNSDVLVAKGWQEPLEHALATGWHLAGPVSNAPGVTAGSLQEVRAYLPDYRLSDNLLDVALTQDALERQYCNQVVSARAINGFWMAAYTDVWWSGAYSVTEVYQPSNDRMPSGRVNKTPLMTGSEDELQARWRKLGRRSGIALGSFVFHYRSVSRGEKFIKGAALRRAS